jgi:hypothetical protein
VSTLTKAESQITQSEACQTGRDIFSSSGAECPSVAPRGSRKIVNLVS